MEVLMKEVIVALVKKLILVLTTNQQGRLFFHDFIIYLASNNIIKTIFIRCQSKS